ncbi:hypothetical protein V498_08657 [Pseudogymnoascus sp. VKM F-4517 (FW-2822)]|nr:hypothetical protein V498_08657 [Pseudogymnoascus sp. VKM F-4517 (FW-2822)]
MINLLLQKYNKNREQQERGRRILAWVAFAERPISLSELRDALATPLNLEGAELSSYVLEDNRPNQLDKAILSSCGGLVEVRDSHSGRIVQLIHQTAREFLLHKDKHAEPYHLDEVQGDTEIAMTCFQYLSIAFCPGFPPSEANAELPKLEIVVEHLSEKPLILYVLENFQSHVHHLGNNNKKIQGAFMNYVKLLALRSNSYASILLGHWIKALGWPTKLYVDEILAGLYLHFLLLYVADAEKDVAKVLLSLQPDLLHIEAGKRHPLTTEQLLENGPHIIAQSIGGRTPRTTAYENLRVLMDLGADINLKDTAGRTPLSYAAENGHKDSMMLLLERGADVNSKDAAGRTPLSYAAENGHKDSIMLLLERGADVNSKDTAS